MNTIFIVICLIGIPYLISLYIYKANNKIKNYVNFLKYEKMPTDLRYGDLIFNETDVECMHPYPCKGRIDQGFLINNKFVPLDTKTRKRHRFYESDVVQLSLYTYIIYHRYRLQPAFYGYVRTVVFNERGKTIEYHAVKLYSFDYLERFIFKQKGNHAAV